MAEKFLRIILYALLLTPLWVFSIFLFPFITSKILYFRILLEAALVLYLILALKHPELRPRWHNPLLRLGWLYVGVILLTSVLGLNFSSSFWGDIERGEGIITILHFVVYFTILPAVFRTQADWYKYLLFALSVTLVTALYGLGQLLNFPFVIHAGATRISGTIGNASFFAAVMLFGIFLALYLLRFAPSKRQRVYLWAIFFIELLVLFESRTRGAILAAAGAFIIYFLFNIFRAESRKLKLTSAALLVLLSLSAVTIYLNRQAPWVQANNTLYRLTTISLSDITTQSRFDTWQASWRGLKDRFWTGYGYENYNIAFNKYFPARIFKDQGSQIWFDRAHNVVFDIAVTSGIVGLVVYLSIFGAAFWIIFRLYRRAEPDLGFRTPVILGVLLLAYFLQNLFVFDTQATYLMFFLVLGYIASLRDQYLAPKPALKPKQSYDPGLIFPLILTGLMFFTAYFVNLEPAFANYYTTQGIRVTKLKTYREFLPTFKRALAYGTYMDEEIRQRLADLSRETELSGQLSSEEQQEMYEFVISELQKSIKESPHDVKNYLYLMSVFNRFPAKLGNAEQVLTLGQEALRFSSTRPQIYFELGQAYFAQKDFPAGLEQFRKAIELNPEVKDSHLNYLLAGLLAKQPDIVVAETKIITQDLGYTLNYTEYLSMARASLQVGDREAAARNYEQALALNPDSAELHAKLAAVYGELCEVEKARFQVTETVRLNNAFQAEAQEFLRQLAEKCQK